MALADSLEGDGSLVDQRAVTRRFVIWVAISQQVWDETTTTETREWVALTRAAAEAAVAANVQPAGPTNETYTWSLDEDNRYVGGTGSYKVKRLSENKTYAQVT